MTFEEAIKKAIQHYWDEEVEDDTPAMTKLGNRKYTKAYFDEIETEFLPKKDVKKLPKK